MIQAFSHSFESSCSTRGGFSSTIRRWGLDNQLVCPARSIHLTAGSIPSIRDQPLLHFYHNVFKGGAADPLHTNEVTLAEDGKTTEIGGVKIQFHRYAPLLLDIHIHY
jgi:hypothetical protein